MTGDVLTSIDGGVGRIRLNRPKAIHALTTGMCEVMSNALLKWREDPSVHAVIIDHAEGRGFCAGGDVVMLARSGDTDAEDAKRFFFAEYRLNQLLFSYPKPTVAIMDGITMGGGVGISLPCSYRLATENTRFAMPETSIGLFPDVGGGECHYLHLATHYVEQSSLPDLVERFLKAPDRLQGALGAAAVNAPAAKIEQNLPLIARLFASDRLEEIVAALSADDSDWAKSERATLGTKSPLSRKVSLRLLAEGAHRASFADEMRAEYALASRVVRTHDFREGVRALLIDKDNAPQWDPATPEEVTEEMLDVLFAPLPETEAWTPFAEAETVA